MSLVPRMSVEGVEIHFEGDHPHTVVMVHGWPDTYRLWDATVAALKDRYCCVRFTLPGFDLAAPPRLTSLDDMCDWLHTVVEQVSPGVPVTLLLHDWGCIFGYEFAARFPGRVGRIIAVDIGDHNSDALAQSLTPGQRAYGWGYQFWLALAWKLGGSAGRWMTRAMARQLGSRVDPALIDWQMNYPYAMRRFGLAGGLSHAVPVRPACPLLYIYGTRKPFMFHSPDWLEWARAQPGNQVQALPTSHWVMLHKPEAFLRCVTDWLSASDDTH